MKYVNREHKEFKTCNDCEKEYPCTKEFFHLSYRTKDGFKGLCKFCLATRYHKKRKKKVDLNRILTERLTCLRSRSKLMKLRFETDLDFGIDYLLSLWEEQKGLCALSGIPMTYILYTGKINTNVSVDRIDSVKGYIKGNIQLVCAAVNKMKLNMYLPELVFYCKSIADYNKNNLNELHA